MRSPTALLLLFLTMLATRHAAAAELTPYMKDQRLGVVIKTIGLPETFPKDLVSGLTNKLLIRVSLVSHSKLVDQSTTEISVKYDLWDETFAVTSTVNGVVIDTRACKTLMEVQALLTELRLPGLFARADVPRADRVVLRAEILLNPIERERLASIRRWVAENSTYAPSDTDGFGSEKGLGGSRSNAIFNRIFEQYSQGMELVAAWKETASSEPFEIEDIASE
jgi:hypothetical protein